MRTVSRGIVLFIMLIASSAIPAADPSPDWTLVSVKGERVHLADEVSQQTTLLFFWATWCPYCKALMPHLQSIRLEHGESVKILAIHFRDDDDPAAFIENAGYDFTVLPNGDDIAKVYGVWGTPGVIIVDKDMQIVFDLYKLPRQEAPQGENSHKRKAAYRAPYWAAEIRMAVDAMARSSPRHTGK